MAVSRRWGPASGALRRRPVTSYLTGAFAAAAVLFGMTFPAVASSPASLGVVIVGSGAVTSQPTGISCPGQCTATFAAGTKVVLTPKPRNGSLFLRWGGACSGALTCTVSVSTLTVVGAQFLAGPRTPPGPVAKYVAVPGPYSGSTGQGRGITFYVVPGGASIRNVSFPTTGLSCTPSPGGTYDELQILQLPLKPNGSFTAETSQEGVLFGSKAKFTYALTGQFQVATATTPATAAGTWREDIKFASGTTASCTSNDQSWTANLYREPSWQKSVVKAGNYSGSTGQGRGMTFSVAPGGTSMLNVSFPTTGLSCTPSPGGTYDHLQVAQVAIRPDGSFSSTTSQQGELLGGGAKITYMFAGYFEGPTPAGAVTVAGTWREDVVFSSGTTTLCTSNLQSWTATLQS